MILMQGNKCIVILQMVGLFSYGVISFANALFYIWTTNVYISELKFPVACAYRIHIFVYFYSCFVDL